MNQGSPGGLNPSYESSTVNYTDEQRLLIFVVSYQPEATDDEVREAIEALERDEPAEATDEEVREIFADQDEHGRTAREVSEIEAVR